MATPSLQQQIEDLARSGNRYSVQDFRAKMDTLLDELRKTNPFRAAQLEAEHYTPMAILDYPEAMSRLRGVIDAADAGAKDKMFAFSTLAKLTRGRVAKAENNEYRRQALLLAQQTGETLRELVILTNWGIIASEDGDDELAEIKFGEAERAVSRLSPEDSQHRVVHEVRSRRAAVAGKRLLKGLRSAEVSHSDIRYQNGLALMREALAALPSDPHRQVNTRLEFGAELIDLGIRWFSITAGDIEELLEHAHRGLNAHPCAFCEAYYPEVLGKQLCLKGRAYLPRRSAQGFELWKQGISELGRARERLLSMDHPKAKEIDDMIKNANAELAAEARPRKIFLSHSSKDKDVARQFKSLLGTVGFEPWLDEDAMVAGTTLERGLLAGMQDSCAAVFLVTENFEDRRYLATEVDYAVGQTYEKSYFKIVTLVLWGAKDDAVPPLLRRFVWKQPQSLLVAATELIRALPLESIRPVWRDTP